MNITLSDGTVVPSRYDFNEAVGVLPVHNQGQSPICWYETHATLIEAFNMKAGHSIHLNPQQLGYEDVSPTAKRWVDQRTSKDLGTIDYAGDNIWSLPGYTDMPRKEALVKAISEAGILDGGVICQHSFERLWEHPAKYLHWDKSKHRFISLPVLHLLPGDKPRSWSHATPFTGYDWLLGLLVQNSWGHGFGLNGRAFIGWDMVEAGVVDSAFLDTWTPA